MAILTLNGDRAAEFCIELRRPPATQPALAVGAVNGSLISDTDDGELICGFKSDGTLVLGDSVKSAVAAVAFFMVIERCWREFSGGHFQSGYQGSDLGDWLTRIMADVPTRDRLAELAEEVAAAEKAR